MHSDMKKAHHTMPCEYLLSMFGLWPIGFSAKLSEHELHTCTTVHTYIHTDSHSGSSSRPGPTRPVAESARSSSGRSHPPLRPSVWILKVWNQMWTRHGRAFSCSCPPRSASTPQMRGEVAAAVKYDGSYTGPCRPSRHRLAPLRVPHRQQTGEVECWCWTPS